MDCSHMEACSAQHPWGGVALRWAPGDSAQAGTPEHLCFDSSNPERTLHTRNKQWRKTLGETAEVQPQQDPGKSSGWTALVRKTHRTGHDGAKSARERERERERERKRERERERETRLGYAAESGSCFIFHHHLYTLCWFISKGQISIQT